MKAILALLTVLILTSCGTKRIVMVKNDSYDIGNRAKIYVTSIKDKGKKFDIGLSITSTTDERLIIQKSDLGCGKGEVTGSIIKYGKLRGPFVVISSGHMRNFYLVCRVDTDTEGDFFVSFNKVYDTKKNSIAPSKVVLKDLKWSIN